MAQRLRTLYRVPAPGVELGRRGGGGTAQEVTRTSDQVRRSDRWTDRPASRSEPTAPGRSSAARRSSLDPNSGCRGGFKAPGLDNQVNIRSTGSAGPAGPRQRGLRHRAGLRQQQRRPDLLRGPPGRDRPPDRCRHRRLPAAALPLPHRRGPRQQLRRQRHLRDRSAAVPDPRGHPEGQRRRRADLHRSARRRARRRTGRCGTSTSRAAASSGWWTPTVCPGTPALDILNLDPNAAARRPTGRPRSGSTGTGPPAATVASTPTSAASPPLARRTDSDRTHSDRCSGSC